MTTVVIDNNNPQAQELLNYINTFPFARVIKRKTKQQSEWDKAIADGAVTPQEFHAMFEKEIKNNW